MNITARLDRIEQQLTHRSAQASRPVKEPMPPEWWAQFRQRYEELLLGRIITPWETALADAREMVARPPSTEPIDYDQMREDLAEFIAENRVAMEESE